MSLLLLRGAAKRFPGLFLSAATNYVNDNPSAGAAAWSLYGITPTRETAAPVPFPAGITTCHKIVGAGEAYPDGYISASIATVPGDVWTISAYVHCSAYSSGAFVMAAQTWEGATARRGWGDTTVRVSVGAVNASFVRVSKAITIAANEDTIRARVVLGSAAAVGTFYVTGAMLEKSSVLTPYFDGSYLSCRWTGAANASTSTRTVSA